MRLGRGFPKAGMWIAAGCLALAMPAFGSPPPIVNLSETPAGAQTAPPAPNPGMLELLQQVQDLRRRVESLQNQVEIEGHTIDQLQSQQRDFFTDVDTRLDTLQKAVTATPPASSPATTPSGDAQAGSHGVPAETQKAYDRAFGLLRAGHYHRAITAFQAFIKAHGQSALADSAHFWVAETYYALGSYSAAATEYRIVATRFPKSARVPDALFKAGLSESHLGHRAEAHALWTSLIRRFPKSDAAKRARAILKGTPRH